MHPHPHRPSTSSSYSHSSHPPSPPSFRSTVKSSRSFLLGSCGTPPSSIPRLHHLPILYLLIAFILPSLTFTLAQPPIPFTSVTPPYHSPDQSDGIKFFAYLNITSPAKMIGTMAFIPAPLSGPTLRADDLTQPYVDAKIILAHTDNNSRFGTCGTYKSVNDEGDNLAGNILLVERGGLPDCTSFAAKTLAAAAAGAKAILFHGCPTSAPDSCRDLLSIVLASASMPIPILYISTSDGYAMRNYLLARRAAYYASIGTNFTSPLPASTDTTLPLLIRVNSAGQMHPDERSALSAIIHGGFTHSVKSLVGQTSLRAWNTTNIDDPTLDPCLDRFAGVYCESGHILSLYLEQLGFTGNISSYFANFTYLRAISAGTNNIARIDDAICTLKELRIFSFNRVGLQAIPDCIGTLQYLHFISVNMNELTYLPTTLPQLGSILRILQMNSNKLGLRTSTNANRTVLIPDGWYSFPLLWRIDVSNNPYFGSALTTPYSLPSFTNYPQLDSVYFSTSGLSGQLSVSMFDNCSMLTFIDMSLNSISGTLPSLVGTKILTIILLNNNRYNSSIPTSWSQLISVTVVKLQNNKLVTPVSSLGRMLSIQTLWLSNNMITLPSTVADVGALITSLAQNSLKELLLDNNQITGPWLIGSFTTNSAKLIQTINVANNGITSLSPDLFGIPTLVNVDMSGNNLTGMMPLGSPPISLTYLNLQRNPRLVIYPLPSWCATLSDMVVSINDASYLCPLLGSLTSVTMQMRVDASFTNYNGCVCARGFFGYPPLCQPVPQSASVSPFTGFTSDEIGSQFEQMIQTKIGRNGTIGDGSVRTTSDTTVGEVERPSDSSNSSSATPTPAVTSTLQHNSAICDEWYGSQRLTLGVSTSWSIDLSSIYLNEQTGKVEHTDTKYPSKQAPISPTLVSSNPLQYTPVRVITVRIHINLNVFDSLTDKLDIFEGESDLKGIRLLSIDGRSKIPSTQSIVNEVISSVQYQTFYSDGLAALGNHTGFIELTSYARILTLYFSSRDVDSLHFFTTYQYEFRCPTGYWIPDDELNGDDDDDDGDSGDSVGGESITSDGDSTVTDPYTDLMRCQPLPRVYSVSEPLRIAVLVSGSFTVVIIIAIIILTSLHWNSVIMRAASRRFVMGILICLMLLGCGSLLYAVTPDPNVATSELVCNTRAWLTGLPLSGLLGIVLAKTARVVSIFSSDRLVVVSRKVGDTRVMKFAGLIMLMECIALLVFTLLPLSRPQSLLSNNTSTGLSIVISCSREPGFYTWIIFQIVFFSILMLASLFFAYKTRSLVTAFNESQHILNTVLVLLFTTCIMIPLIVYVQANPEASMLLQGFGQAFLTVLLASFLFAPKLWFIYAYNSADQKLLLTSPPSQLANNIIVANHGHGGFGTATLGGHHGSIMCNTGTMNTGFNNGGMMTPVHGVHNTTTDGGGLMSGTEFMMKNGGGDTTSDISSGHSTPVLQPIGGTTGQRGSVTAVTLVTAVTPKRAVAPALPRKNGSTSSPMRSKTGTSIGMLAKKQGTNAGNGSGSGTPILHSITPAPPADLAVGTASPPSSTELRRMTRNEMNRTAVTALQMLSASNPSVKVASLPQLTLDRIEGGGGEATVGDGFSGTVTKRHSLPEGTFSLTKGSSYPPVLISPTSAATTVAASQVYSASVSSEKNPKNKPKPSEDLNLASRLIMPLGRKGGSAQVAHMPMPTTVYQPPSTLPISTPIAFVPTLDMGNIHLPSFESDDDTSETSLEHDEDSVFSPRVRISSTTAAAMIMPQPQTPVKKQSVVGTLIGTIQDDE